MTPAFTPSTLGGAPASKGSPAKHRPLPGHGLKPLAIVGAAGTGSPSTPRLNAAKDARKRAEKTKPEPISDLIRRLPADSPGRALYAQTASAHGGPAAAEALRAWLAGQ